MKNILIVMLLAMPCISLASTKALDYCATVESWAAVKAIDNLVQKNQALDPQRATSSLLERTELKDKNDSSYTRGLGQLYTQTIKITVPFVGNKKSTNDDNCFVDNIG